MIISQGEFYDTNPLRAISFNEFIENQNDKKIQEWIGLVIFAVDEEAINSDFMLKVYDHKSRETYWLHGDREDMIVRKPPDRFSIKSQDELFVVEFDEFYERYKRVRETGEEE